MTNKLIAHWKFDGDLTDSSGNGFDGAPSGTLSYVDGKIGQALYFNGGNNRVNLPAMIETASEVSVGGWIYFEDNAGKNSHFLTATWSWGTTKGFILRRNLTTAGHDKEFCIVIGHTFYFFDKVLTSDEWFHLFVTNTGTTTKLYINGVLEQTMTTIPIPYGGGYNSIGAESVNYHKGMMDDWRIYTGVLSEGEIKAIYFQEGTQKKVVSKPYPSPHTNISITRTLNAIKRANG